MCDVYGARYSISMVSQKETRFTKKERGYLEREVPKLALMIADKKERTEWMRVELERCAFKARHNQKRLQGLHVGVLGLEDANERSKVRAEIQNIEREVGDSLFTIATKKSDVRRQMKLVKECEERLRIIQETLRLQK